MARFITTIKFTEKGLDQIKDTSKRAAAFKSAAKKMGVKVSEIYWTLGAFDGLIIFDAADDESATAAMLRLSSQDYVRTNTLRAFDAGEIEKVVAKMGK